MIESVTLILLAILSIFFIGGNGSRINSKVSVVIPAFNEQKAIEHVIETVKQVSDITQIIVVDDGSTDKTHSILKDIQGIELYTHNTNKGKGMAMKTGLRHVNNEVVLFLDADLIEINKKQVEAIIKPILDGSADLTKTKFKREAGRVTELTAKPLLNFFFPELSFEQPLSGQFATLKRFLDSIDLEKDYGVDIGIVLDADARGMRIQEVDIGNIVHDMSTLKELNVMATEVVRTIVDKAISYGRLTMVDDLGGSIRMELLGLTIIIFGIFGLFFIKFMNIYFAVIITLIGLIISVWYLYRIIKMSIKVYRQSKLSKRQLLSVFIKTHFPIVISVIILLLLVGSVLSSVSISSNEITIEPTSKSLVISSSSQENNVDVRGPYTIENALENEEDLIRLSTSALSTLNAQYGDTVYIDGEAYTLDQALEDEGDLIRMPEDARMALQVSPGDVIRDSDMLSLFEQTSIVNTITPNVEQLEQERDVNGTQIGVDVNTTNISVGIDHISYSLPEKKLSVYVNDTLIGTSTGAIENNTYNVYVNGSYLESLYLNDTSTGLIYNTTYNNSSIEVVLEDTDSNTTSMFASRSSVVKFIDIHLNDSNIT
ncbi:MAG: glycosyltransferase [Methanosphaera sp.]|nr:glycosyltransferase [Methanosphaera sp.]